MTMTEYALKFIGTPYVWGGAGPYFDCSGFIIEVFQAYGLLPSGDWTADTLSVKLVADGWREVKEQPREGDVLFFGENNFTHVALMVSNTQYIEAGSGTRKCTTPVNSTGMVRLRPFGFRKANLILRRYANEAEKVQANTQQGAVK